MSGLFFIPTVSGMDAAEPWQLGFQDAASPVMQGIIDLHHDIFFFVVFVTCFVVWMLGRTLYHFHHTRQPIPEKIVHGTAIEIAWTVTPSLILILIAVPSFALLYSMEEVVDPAMTFKAIGHQWYWSYEYSDQMDHLPLFDDYQIGFDSYMIPEEDLQAGELRLLEVDNRVVLPTHTHIRVIITAADVLHSWAVPSLGIKCDAVPGRLNQVSTFIQREGVFYGQCSEICGTNHGFMPIVVEAVPLTKYVEWVEQKLTAGFLDDAPAPRWMDGVSNVPDVPEVLEDHQEVLEECQEVLEDSQEALEDCQEVLEENPEVLEESPDVLEETPEPEVVEQPQTQ